MWNKILEEARSSWLGENNNIMLSMCDRFEDLMESKIQFVRIWHKHGGDVIAYKQEHDPTENELKAIEKAFTEDHDCDPESTGASYEGYHTISEILSLKSIETTIALGGWNQTNLDYDGDVLDEDLDADDVFEAQHSNSPTIEYS